MDWGEAVYQFLVFLCPNVVGPLWPEKTPAERMHSEHGHLSPVPAQLTQGACPVNLAFRWKMSGVGWFRRFSQYCILGLEKGRKDSHNKASPRAVNVCFGGAGKFRNPLRRVTHHFAFSNTCVISVQAFGEREESGFSRAGAWPLVFPLSWHLVEGCQCHWSQKPVSHEAVVCWEGGPNLCICHSLSKQANCFPNLPPYK
ncbi:hypothetical protein QTO34_006604 [Cnephaeus nilssonii]|uniref:Uncharacterized protein n=1 Tax=Cnephaeus nilssonii TaxID=3371016 RepID=A0AA40HKU3_CNENI|nr:hypothetical protein QTO34_006604 [Eptesicus nilssonii]